MTRRDRSLPRATYRLQLHAGFSLDDAAAVVPYLSELGISHVYASPVLQAASGSTHGYDVIDHSRVSDELGGAEAFARLTDALRAHGMGLVLDIVPNHMAISVAENRWWWDVLEHGPASRYASYFDVDWDPPESRLRNVILLPVLPDHYGRVLESGGLRLARRGTRLVVEHDGRPFPLDPRTLASLVTGAAERVGSGEMALIGNALGALPSSTAPDVELVARRQRDANVLLGRLDRLLGQPEPAEAIDVVIARTNADPDRLDALLEEQNYRLAFWRASARDLGYRRFFDINELIGLRMEDPSVFSETHRLVLGWVSDGIVDGLRIDHPDGMRDPAAYFARLRAAAPGAWIVVEKILERDEKLPRTWPVDGTTGYRFASLVTGLFVDPDGRDGMTELWAGVADTGPAWDSIAADARAEVLSSVLGSDVNRLTDLFVAVCEANRRYRDFTRHELHRTLREVAVRMPVYRTYLTASPRQVPAADARLIGTAVGEAATARPDLDPELFELLGRILRLEIGGPLADELAMRFQQLTPAAMAKGVEDTAFYRHHRLVALNEVGGDPGHFGTSPEEFHRHMEASAVEWPTAMLTLSTHDTKRSADVRARLAVLAEDPAEWRLTVGRLARAAEPHRTGPDLPTRADAYLFFQTIVGAWPIEADRAAAYLEKASREAKLRTSWTAPDAAYDEALARFVRGCLGDAEFVSLVEAIVSPIVDAGRRAALGMLALELTAPGVPDLYQGSELWELALVDPDNRRPVDYGRRRRLLVDACGLHAAGAWARRDEGLPKLWLVRHALEMRRRRPTVFDPDGGYQPLAADGSLHDAVIAFERGGRIVTVVPRLVRRVEREGWGDTTLGLPDGRWRNLDGEVYAGWARLSALLATFPVALLERQP